jgi:Lipocalin-like domain
MNRLAHNALSAATLAVVVCLSNSAWAQQSLKEQLIGTWTLVSNVVEHPDGTRVEQFGDNPSGILIFSSDSHFVTVNTRSDLPKLASGNRVQVTPDEATAITKGTLAYYGTYSVDDASKVITVRIDGSTFANQNGTVQKRLITSLTGDEMKFTNPAATSGGKLELVWKRAK